jgi:outer membrane protein assembly factor BamC
MKQDNFQRLTSPQQSLPLRRKVPRLAVVALAGLVASGCSVLEEDKVDYRSAKQVNTLEVPPDLTQLTRETRYAAPRSVVTANGYDATQPAQRVPTAAASVGDVRIERSGNQRWLVVDRPADKLWEPIRDFWQENGFLLALDQENLGLMETDWAENRAKIPQDFIRASLGKLFDNLYSTGERDKFRTRLERNAAGGTEIYISHRGMVEVYSNEDKNNTVWQPRPADPELEAEFLRRLMVKLGLTQEQSKALLATNSTPPTAKVDTVNGQPVVQLSEGFDRAWRRVGLALDRTGFTVEDRDRAQGVYFVRYVEADAATAQEKPGFFARLFGASAKEATPVRYRINVKTSGEQTTVSVFDAAGKPEASATAQRIVKVIADDLK